jgi:hypothetical protein
MYITSLKTILQETMEQTYNQSYPESDFRGLNVSIEYPMKQEDYPGIWVDFTPSRPIQSAGINHVEYTSLDGNGQRRRSTVFTYGGSIQYTCVALTSVERDRLVDEVVKILAFGLLNPERSIYREKLLSNDLIAIDPQWDRFDAGGKAENQGTPWGTEEIVYEMTVGMDATGTFYVDQQDVTLVPLSAIKVYEWVQGQTPPPETAGGGWQ